MKRFVFLEFIHFVLICSYIRVIYICMFPAGYFRQRTYVAQGRLEAHFAQLFTHIINKRANSVNY